MEIKRREHVRNIEGRSRIPKWHPERKERATKQKENQKEKRDSERGKKLQGKKRSRKKREHQKEKSESEREGSIEDEKNDQKMKNHLQSRS